ncbi:MAG: hypothetical protein AABW79_01650 [Nanoarchaeota archaeon]
MKKLVFILFVLAFIAPIVSAEILFSQLGQSYSFGDQVNAKLTLTSEVAQTDYLVVKLMCGTSSVEFYRVPVSFSGAGEKEIDLSFMTSTALFSELSGNCNFDATYSGENRQSSSFLLTRSLFIEPVFEKRVYLPDEIVKVSGTAKTPNGRAIEGYATASFAGVTLSVPVRAGSFAFEFKLPHDIAPSEQEFSLRVYEKDSAGYVSNEASYTTSLTISEILDKISIVVKEDQITPGLKSSFSVYAFDQVGNKIFRDAIFRIYSPQGKVVYSEVFATDSVKEYYFEPNSSSGNWRFEAESESKKDVLNVYAVENEQASFFVEDGTLVVKNIGNVDYNEVVNILFNDVSLARELSVPVGETKKLKLSAPDSNYTITVSDGREQFLGVNVPLTGRAIDVSESSFLSSGYSFLPFIILLVLVVGGIFGIRSYRANRSYGMISNEPAFQKNVVTRTVNLTSASFSDGEKEDAAIMALSIGNIGRNESASLIGEIKAEMQKEKAHVIDEGSMLIGLFTKRIGGEDFNQRALRAAYNSSLKLQEHSKSDRLKLNAGIGVSDGQLITGYEKGKLSYASVQNSIGRAKNIAASSGGNLVVGEGYYRKIMGDVNAERAEKGWKINRMKDHASHKGFIDKFTERNNFRRLGEFKR